jgi:hypothetical protein
VQRTGNYASGMDSSSVFQPAFEWMYASHISQSMYVSHITQSVDVSHIILKIIISLQAQAHGNGEVYFVEYRLEKESLLQHARVELSRPARLDMHHSTRNASPRLDMHHSTRNASPRLDMHHSTRNASPRLDMHHSATLKMHHRDTRPLIHLDITLPQP